MEQDQFDDVPHPARSIPNAISPIGRRPLVSVLTPSFGQAAWLSDNLRSVQAQTYPAIEHIVMDGGSSDGTLDVLRRDAGARVAWRSEPDEGQSHALNKAFNNSRGEIIGWLNSDDAYFGPTVVEEAVEVFAADPRVAVVYGHALLADADGRILQVIWTPPFSRTLLRLHDFILQPAAFIRRSVLSGTLVDESFDYSMDYELWLRLAQRHRFQRLDRIIAIDRHHLARKSYTMLDVGRADHARLSQRYGVARGALATVGRKAWKIVSRAAGVRLITAATEESVVFSARRDSRARLLLRQLTTPRAAMRSGNG